MIVRTGLRSVRYIKEIPGLTKVTINDMLPVATETAKVQCVRVRYVIFTIL